MRVLKEVLSAQKFEKDFHIKQRVSGFWLLMAGCYKTVEFDESRQAMFLALAIILAIVYVLLLVMAHTVHFFFHLVIILAVISLVVHLVRGNK